MERPELPFEVVAVKDGRRLCWIDRETAYALENLAAVGPLPKVLNVLTHFAHVLVDVRETFK